MRRPVLIFFLFTLCLSFPSKAEVITTVDSDNKDSKLYRYVNAYIISSSLYTNAVNVNQKLNFECYQPYEILPGKMTIIQPVVFQNEKIHPITGIWSHRYSLTRCGKQITYNAYIISANGEHPKLITGLNGNTKVPLSGLIDISTSSYQYALDKMAKCATPNPFISNTSVIHTDFETKTDWQERWEVKICGEVKFLKIILHIKNDKISYKIEPDSLYTVKTE